MQQKLGVKQDLGAPVPAASDLIVAILFYRGLDTHNPGKTVGNGLAQQ